MASNESKLVAQVRSDFGKGARDESRGEKAGRGGHGLTSFG